VRRNRILRAELNCHSHGEWSFDFAFNKEICGLLQFLQGLHVGSLRIAL